MDSLSRLLGLLLQTASIGEVQSGNDGSPHKMIEHVSKGNFDAALKENLLILTSLKSKAVAGPNNRDAFSITSYGHHWCTRGQILAAMGSIKEARQALQEALDYAASKDSMGWFDSPLVRWKDVVDITKAFIAEKDQDIPTATPLYENLEQYGFGRLAVIALARSNLADASKWAGKGIATGEPSAYFAQGQLQEMNGNKRDALESYENAVKLLEKGAVAGKSNNFTPVFYVDGKAILEARNRLAK